MDEMVEKFTDFAGRERRFRIRLESTPGGLRAEALEDGQQAGGYRFRVVAASGGTAEALSKLRSRMAQVLNVRHILRRPSTGDWGVTHDVLRGRIAFDKETNGPMIVIDGQPLDWDEFGRLMLEHEAFDFELQFRE